MPELEDRKDAEWEAVFDALLAGTPTAADEAWTAFEQRFDVWQEDDDL